MDFNKFLTSVTKRRRSSMIRKWAKAFLRNPNSITLANGMPNAETFPLKEVSMTLNDGTKKVLRDKELCECLQYGPSQGYPPLIAKWRDFQEKYHRPLNNNWDVLFTSGSQDGCSKVFDMLVEEGDPVLIQTPTYTGIINAEVPFDRIISSEFNGNFNRRAPITDNSRKQLTIKLSWISVNCFLVLYIVSYCYGSFFAYSNRLNGIMDCNKFLNEVTKRREVTLPMLLACSDENAINLAEGQPNLDIFPVVDINMRLRGSKSYTSFNKNEMKEAFGLGAAQGCEMLLRELHDMQKRYHRPRRSDWGLIVTTGTQEGMCKVFEAIVEKGKPVMVQTPSYFGVHGILAPILPEFIGIEQDGDGIKPEIIENVCDERIRTGKALPKLLYVNPTGANPSGTVLSEVRRRRIYDLARKYDFLILEDDPYYFIHFLEKRPTSFFSLDTDGRVIRLDSFSKIMSAGIRLGVVTAHKEFLTKLIVHVESSIMHTSALSQVLLYKLLESWGPEKLDKHFKDVQLFYQRKRDIMLAAVEKHLTGLAEWTVPQGGMFVWIKVTALDDVMDLALNKCSTNGVFVLPGHAFEYDVTKPNRYLRLCYSYANPDEIDKALSIVAKFIKAGASMKNVQ